MVSDEEEKRLIELAKQFFGSPNAELEQSVFVKKTLRSIGYFNLGCGVLAGAIAAFLVPILILWARTLPMGGRVPVFTFTLGLAAFPLVMLYKAIRSFFGTTLFGSANSLEEALERFYQKAIGDSTKSLTMSDRSELLKHTVPLFPKPVFQYYLKRLNEISSAWDGLRKQFAKEDEPFKVSITDLITKKLDETTLSVELRICNTRFKNVALEKNGHWYLINMFPIVIEEREENARR